MKAALERRPKIKERIFSEEERGYCERRNAPEIHYAMRFAAKEAVLKASAPGSGMRFTDVEVVRESNGRPVPRLSGRAAEVAAERGIIEMHLSLSFTHSTAVASAVAITEARGRRRTSGSTRWPSSRRRSRRPEPCSTLRSSRTVTRTSRSGLSRQKSRPAGGRGGSQARVRGSASCGSDTSVATTCSLPSRCVSLRNGPSR